LLKALGRLDEAKYHCLTGCPLFANSTGGRQRAPTAAANYWHAT